MSSGFNEKLLSKRLTSLRKRKDLTTDEFTEKNSSILIETLGAIENRDDEDYFYAQLNKCSKFLGNQLQKEWNTKKLREKFVLSFKTRSHLFPDEDLQFIIKTVFQMITSRLYQIRKETVPKASSMLLKLFLNEMLTYTKKEEMLDLFDQWGGNNWGPKHLKDDIVPKSWSQCIDKMKKYTESLWNKELEGSNPLSTFRAYIAFRSFLLALFLYFAWNTSYFVKTSKLLIKYIQNKAVEEIESREVSNNNQLSEMLNQSHDQMKLSLMGFLEQKSDSFCMWRELIPNVTSIPWEDVFSELDSSTFDNIKKFTIELPPKKMFLEEVLYALNVKVPKDSEYLINRLTVTLYLHYSPNVQSYVVSMYTIMSLIDIMSLMLKTKAIQSLNLTPRESYCDNIDCDSPSDKPLLQCSQCKLRRYCSETCQKVHWKASHSKQCAQFKKALSVIM